LLTFGTPVSVAVIQKKTFPTENPEGTHADHGQQVFVFLACANPALHLFCTTIKIERRHKLSGEKWLGS
jgi:hypothetical protein